MQNTNHILTDISAQLNNFMSLDHSRLEALYTQFRQITGNTTTNDLYSEIQLKEIEKNLRRMHKPGSILKRDVAFLMARNGMLGVIEKMVSMEVEVKV